MYSCFSYFNLFMLFIQTLHIYWRTTDFCTVAFLTFLSTFECIETYRMRGAVRCRL